MKVMHRIKGEGRKGRDDGKGWMGRERVNAMREMG